MKLYQDLWMQENIWKSQKKKFGVWAKIEMEVYLKDQKGFIK